MVFIACNSEEFSELNPNFLGEVCRCLFGMLKQFPEDFFYDSLSKDNFLRKTLQTFFGICERVGPSGIEKRVEAIKKLLSERFNEEICPEEEDDEYAPVVVDDLYDFVSFN